MQPRQGQWLILAEVRWRILGAFALAEPWFFLCFGSFIRYTNRWMFVYIVDIPRQPRGAKYPALDLNVEVPRAAANDFGAAGF
jgi:hypothetical protein